MLNAGGTHGELVQFGYLAGKRVSSSAPYVVYGKFAIVGIRQSEWPAKFDALSCTNQSQIVAYCVVLVATTLHYPTLHCEHPSPSSPPVAALQALAAAAFGWHRLASEQLPAQT